MKRFWLPLLFFISTLCVNAQDENGSIESPPDTVRIGAYIISIHDINFQDKEYTMRFWLWALYDNVAFDLAKQLDIPNAKSIDDPQVIVDVVNGKTWQLMKIRATMKQNWKVANYPFDKQHLVVHIENTIFEKTRLVFVPDELGSTYDRELTIDGWKISNFEVKVGNNEYTTVFGDPSSDLLHSEYSSFNLVFDIERSGWGLFLKLFTGMYIAFMISMVSFMLHPKEVEPRFGLPVGGLFAAVGNKYIIDSLLPESNTFTLVDSLHSITFLTIFVILVVSAIVLKFHSKGFEARGQKLNNYSAGVVLVLFVIVNLILVIAAIK
ncbi:MAG: hypothetical protein KF725_10665 [Cyclobacteriaceae bacterium]|nr:hypothetical protein [Cyclobacteriaceae bacterium]UYN86171.1 MAG: hypothetical protein KIT51_15055 [Cyclobacteriaceae bacterium]